MHARRRRQPRDGFGGEGKGGESEAKEWRIMADNRKRRCKRETESGRGRDREMEGGRERD